MDATEWSGYGLGRSETERDMSGAWTGWIAWVVLAAVILVASCQVLFAMVEPLP